MRICLLQAISPFLTMFSTVVYFECVKILHCVVMVDLFPHKEGVLKTLMEEPFENIVGKGNNAGNQHFLLFLLCFALCQAYFTFESFFLSSLNFDLSKILLFSQELKGIHARWAGNPLPPKRIIVDLVMPLV